MSPPLWYFVASWAQPPVCCTRCSGRCCGGWCWSWGPTHINTCLVYKLLAIHIAQLLKIATWRKKHVLWWHRIEWCTYSSCRDTSMSVLALMEMSHDTWTHVSTLPDRWARCPCGDTAPIQHRYTPCKIYLPINSILVPEVLKTQVRFQ